MSAVLMIPSAGQPLNSTTPAIVNDGRDQMGLRPGVPLSAQDALNVFLHRGENPERVQYNMRLNAGTGGGRRVPPGVTVWDFVQSAVESSGGFADGSYLWAFPLEIEGGIVSDKLTQRMQMADYDDFAAHICNEYWSMIQGAAEQIRRVAVADTARDLLARFWRNCDGKGTPLGDFLFKPANQARQHGTGLVIVDRLPMDDTASIVDDESPDTDPYLVHVPFRNVVDWQLDDDGELNYLTYVQPAPTDLFAKWHPIRVWTRTESALFAPAGTGSWAGKAPVYVPVSSFPNKLGIIPAVPFYNEPPEDGRFMGKTDMLATARIAQTVFNIDSYVHEILRKAGHPFLQINVANVADYLGGDGQGGNTKLKMSLSNVLLWDGQGSPPAWVHPDLVAIITPMMTTRKEKKEDSYAAASLRAIVGNIQTKSGFHAEVEIEKTENRVARFAGMLAAGEVRLAIFVLMYRGIVSDNASDLVTVTYPSRFNIQDRQAAIDRAAELLQLNPGKTAREKIWRDLFVAIWPTTAEEDLDKMVAEAIAEGKAADAMALKQIVAKAQATAAKGKASPLPDGVDFQPAVEAG